MIFSFFISHCTIESFGPLLLITRLKFIAKGPYNLFFMPFFQVNLGFGGISLQIGHLYRRDWLHEWVLRPVIPPLSPPLATSLGIRELRGVS